VSPLVRISRELAREVDALSFSEPVAYVYNPLDYARRPHEAYLERFGRGPKEVLLLGMNPGPFGMAQTGVPFGEVAAVRDYLGIEARVAAVRDTHPKRPVEGLACKRSEISGARFWGWARQRCPDPAAFFARFFVVNYCPLAFVEQSGRNRTPDKLPVEEREPLYAACDRALARVVEVLSPRWVVGVGVFGEARARAAVGEGAGVRFGAILHPSPANPRANRGWATAAEADLRRLGIPLPGLEVAR
jgi:single-strand selective monofunctional uracil DNA glycosylase